MPIPNVAIVSTALQAPPDAPANYIPIAGIPVPNGDAPFVEAAKTYSSVEEMVDDGFLPSSNAALAATQIFGQGAFQPLTDPPTRVVIIHRAVPVAQVEEFQVEVDDDGDYYLYIGAIGGTAVQAATFNASSNTVTEIKDGLISAFNLGPFAATHTAASVDADSGSITANTAGAPFVLTAEGPNGAVDITISNTTPNSGIFEDLDAAFAIAPFWAVIPDPSVPVGTAYEASRWAEASAALLSQRRNVAILQTNDSDIQDAVEPNFASELVLLNRTRTFVLRHPNLTDKMTAAWFGRYGGGFPGARAWHFAPQGGTTLADDTIIYTVTEGENFKDQRVQWSERDGTSATDALRVYETGPGIGGFFIVQKQAEDFWWLQTLAAIIAEVAGGLNLNDEGINALIAAVNTVNSTLGTQDVIDLNETTVTAIDLSTIPASELALGDYQTTGGINVSTVLIPKLRAVRVSAIFATAPTFV